MNDASEELELPPSLRWLRTLVTVLTGVMIVGIVLIVGLLFVKLRPSELSLPQDLALPTGVVPEAITMGRDWVGVVSADDRIFIFDKSSGALRQEFAID